jgi:hypothetical protein
MAFPAERLAVRNDGEDERAWHLPEGAVVITNKWCRKTSPPPYFIPPAGRAGVSLSIASAIAAAVGVSKKAVSG